MLYLKITTKISYYFLQSLNRSLKTDNQITFHVTSPLQRKTSRDHWNLEEHLGCSEVTSIMKCTLYIDNKGLYCLCSHFVNAYSILYILMSALQYTNNIHSYGYSVLIGQLFLVGRKWKLSWKIVFILKLYLVLYSYDADYLKQFERFSFIRMSSTCWHLFMIKLRKLLRLPVTYNVENILHRHVFKVVVKIS